MRSLILTVAVLLAGAAMTGQAMAYDGHHGHGPSHGYSHHGGPGHGYHGYHYYTPSYHHGCYPPVYVQPRVVVPYYSPYPYGYNRGYSYYHGGMSVNTGRVGISIGF
ncbi:MAG: hypothetical protein ACYC6Y_13345 [Thermoguttaceae bacterium]